MKELHYICGFPRTGSTLLTKILNQNPDFYASTTSPVSTLQRWMRNSVHNTNEFKAIHSDELRELFINSVRGMVEGWHHNQIDKIVFDKSRAWISLRTINDSTFPDAKYIFCVRDLRAIVASMIKLNYRFPQYCHALDVQESSIANNIKMHLENCEASPVADVLNSIVKADILDDPRLKEKLFILRYENLIAKPQTTMNKLYEFLGYDQFEHNFDHIEQGENEHDTVWQGWGEHTIKTHIERDKINTDVIEILGEENSNDILNEYRWFYERFYPESFQ